MKPLIGERATKMFISYRKRLEGPDVSVRIEPAVGLCGLANICPYVKDNLSVGDQARKWGDTFERDFSGVLALQSDVARGMAGALALTLLPRQQAVLTSSARSRRPRAGGFSASGACLAATART